MKSKSLLIILFIIAGCFITGYALTVNKVPVNEECGRVNTAVTPFQQYAGLVTYGQVRIEVKTTSGYIYKFKVYRVGDYVEHGNKICQSKGVRHKVDDFLLY